MVSTRIPVAAQIERFLLDQDWPNALALLEQNWSSLLVLDPQQLRVWAARMPAAFTDRHPRVALALVYLDRILSDSDFATTRFHGDVADRRTSSAFDKVVQLTVRAAAARAGGELADAASFAAEARRVVDESPVAERESMTQGLPEMTYAWAYVWEHVGDADAAFREYTNSFDLALLLGDVMGQARSAAAIAWCHALAGRNRDARTWLDRVPHMGDAWWTARSRAVVALTEALMLRDELRMFEARERLATVELAAAHERSHAHAFVSALVVRDEGEAINLLTRLDSPALQLPVGAQTGQSAAFLALARYVLLRQIAAPGVARDALLGTEKIGGSLMGPVVAAHRVASDAHAGRYANVMREATSLASTTSQTPRALVAALALRASAELRQSNPEHVASMHLALAAAQHNTLYATLALAPAQDLRVLLPGRDSPFFSPMERDILDAAAEGRTDPFEALTARELAVMTTRLQTRTIGETATAQFLSVNTVKTQMRSVYKKLGITSLASLRALAQQHGYAVELP